MKDKLIAQAIQFASGQLEMLEFQHAVRVMFLVRDQMWDEKTQVVAVLHDVIRDGDDIPVYNQIVVAFGIEIADACIHMADKLYESNKLYLKRVKNNPITRIVKIAELFDNLNPERLELIHQSDRKDHEKQLKRRLSFLSSTEEGEPAFEV